MTNTSLIRKNFLLIFMLAMGREKEHIILLQKIALTIKKLREEKGKSQLAGHDDTGMHIGRLENTKNNLTAITISKVCKYFGITMSEFFKKVEEM